MPTVNPWFSSRKEEEVYHNNTECTEGNNIEPYNVERGTGNKRLCQHCQRLNKQATFFGKGLMGGIFGSFGSNPFIASLKNLPE